MNKDQVLALLRAHTPHDAEESDHLLRMLEFVEAHRDFGSRANQAGHLTASSWMVSPNYQYALLTHHRKLDRWLQLGGHIEDDADLLAAATREALEESGLTRVEALSPAIFDVDVHLIPERKTEPAHYHYDVRFAFVADNNAALQVSSESKDLQWIDLTQLAALADERSMIRMAEKTAQFF